jgi:protein involved in polysaccharide export with SLBB domain
MVFIRRGVVESVRITGAVWHPGTYWLTNGTTILNAIQAAGGFRDFAMGVRVTHLDGTTESFPYLLIIDESLEQPQIKAGDRLTVPSRIF